MTSDDVRMCEGCGKRIPRLKWDRPARYARKRFCGNRCAVRSRRGPPQERFWSRVDASGGDGACWLWTGTTYEFGYGQISVNGKNVAAHRYSWQLAHGDPGQMDVLHSCDVPACVNPGHLWLGTHGDNNRDRHKKGRSVVPDPVRGEASRFSKLTAEQVREIRARYGKERTASIARDYGVSRQAVRKIALRLRWRHV